MIKRAAKRTVWVGPWKPGHSVMMGWLGIAFSPPTLPQRTRKNGAPIFYMCLVSHLEWVGHPAKAGTPHYRMTPSFCKSWRNWLTFCIWMTCIPRREAMSRFNGRSSIKQHSSGGLCVISRARR